MPQYYFHISTKESMFPDEEGVSLNDLAAAHTCAINIMYKTMLYDPEQDWRGWMIKIADADGRIVLTLLYPSQEPLLRRTFGNRQRFSSHRVPLVGLVASAALCGLTLIQPAEGSSSLTCVRSAYSFSCVVSSGNGSDVARTLHVRYPATAEDKALSAERERKWIARCQPTIHQDGYGVGRYRYAAAGCAFGKSED